MGEGEIKAVKGMSASGGVGLFLAVSETRTCGGVLFLCKQRMRSVPARLLYAARLIVVTG